MPKIIGDLRESILASAKQILLEEGYEKLTIRSVAKACGVASGTIYNYFASKEMLEASVMLEDWIAAIRSMKERTNEDLPLTEALQCIYEEISGYAMIYARAWADSEQAAKSPSLLFIYERHLQLVNQLCEIVIPLFEKEGIYNPALSGPIVTERLLQEASSGNRDEFQELLALTEHLRGGKSI